MAGDKRLGCGIPSVYITRVGGGQRLTEVKASRVAWRRALDEISDSRVDIATGQDAKCAAVLNELEPFLYETSIYRDDSEAWVGPLTEPAYTINDMSIQSRDLFQWFERRVLPFDRTFVDVDLATIAAQLLVDALDIDPSPNISFTVNNCGVIGSRTVLGITYRRAADEVRELARSGLDFTAVGRRILFGGKEVISPRLPTLTAEMFEIQNFRLVGMSKANHVIVLGATPPGVTTPLVGIAGGDDPPIVTTTVQEPSILDIPSATAAAETRWDLLHLAPQYVTGRFLEDAPVSIDDLIPGCIAEIRQQVGYRYIEGDFRLVGVLVSADVGSDGVKESVDAVFQPVGSMETIG